MQFPLALFDSLRWWSELTNAQQLFYGIGIVAGVATVIQAVLGMFGMGHHDTPDLGHVDAGHDGGIFSVKPLTGFFLGFGWSGGIALEMGASLAVALAVGGGTGTAIMLMIVWMIRAIYALRSDGTRRIADAVGEVATVYVTLPPARAAGGQISVTVSGRKETLAALNTAEQPVASGEKVRVVGVVDSQTVLVEPLR